MTTTRKNTQAAQGGFSLLEMSILLVIVGLLSIPLFQALDTYMNNKRIEVTNTNLEITQNAIDKFVAANGYYPCPAGMLLGVNNPNYGKAVVDPTDPEKKAKLDTETTDTVCTGADSTGGIEEGTDLGGGVTLANERHPILIGNFPFASLGLSRADAIDGYGRPLVYAVTKSMTTRKTYNERLSGVVVERECHGGCAVGMGQGASVDDYQVAPYIILSMGKNGRGAEHADPDQSTTLAAACENSGDLENCDFSNLGATNNRFMTMEGASDEEGNVYDDKLVIGKIQPQSLWATTDDGTIYNRNSGNIGVGTSPTGARLDVAGDMKANELQSGNVCDQNNNCFPARKIAGNDPDMQCPAGQGVYAINEGKVLCRDLAITLNVPPAGPCPVGQLPMGIDTNGNPKCANPNPPPPQAVTITVNDISVQEGQTASFTISLSAASSADISVKVDTQNGTAIAGDDYMARSGIITISAGSTSKSFDVETIGGDGPDDGETFSIVLSDPSPGDLATVNASIADNTGVATILDGIALPILSVVAGPDVTEGNDMKFTVNMSKPSAVDVTVNYQTLGGTAIAGTDYTAANGVVTIPAGQVTVADAITVSTLNDALAEPTETIGVFLSGAVGAVAVQPGNQTTGNLLDGAPIPAISIASLAPATEEGQTARFKIVLSSTPPKDVAVTLAILQPGDTADAADFTPPPLNLTFLANTATLEQIVDVPILDNGPGLLEPEETLTLKIVTATNTDMNKGPLESAIKLIDNTIVVAFNLTAVAGTKVKVAEGEDATIAVTLNRPAPTPINVDFQTLAGGNKPATAGTDYDAVADTLNFAVGETSKIITVKTKSDIITPEDDETVLVRLSNLSAPAKLEGNAAHLDALVTITDVAPNTPIIVIDAQPPKVDIGDDIIITWDIEGASSCNNNYGVNIVPIQGAANGSHTVKATVAGNTTYSITCTAGQATTTRFVEVIVEEPAAAATDVRIWVDDAVAVNEGDDLEFKIRRTKLDDKGIDQPDDIGDITIAYKVVDVTATHGTDYNGAQVGSVDIESGNDFGFITIPTLTDGVAEGDETLRVELTSITAGTGKILRDKGIGTIEDVDAAAIPDGCVAANTMGGIDGAGLAAPKPTALVNDIKVALNAKHGGDYTKTGDADLIAAVNWLETELGKAGGPIINTTHTIGTHTIGINLEMTIEEYTWLGKGVFGPYWAGDVIVCGKPIPPGGSDLLGGKCVNHIINAGENQDPGAAVAALVTKLNTELGTADYNTLGDADLNSAMGAVESGVTSAGPGEVRTDSKTYGHYLGTYSVTMDLAGKIYEGGLSICGGGGAPPPPPAAKTISIADAVGNEGENMIFTITASENAPPGGLNVGVKTTNGTADDGTDYVAQNGSVTILTGQKTTTLTVPITADAVNEAAETFTVTVTVATPGWSATKATATGTIKGVGDITGCVVHEDKSDWRNPSAGLSDWQDKLADNAGVPYAALPPDVKALFDSASSVAGEALAQTRKKSRTQTIGTYTLNMRIDPFLEAWGLFGGMGAPWDYRYSICKN